LKKGDYFFLKLVPFFSEKPLFAKCQRKCHPDILKAKRGKSWRGRRRRTTKDEDDDRRPQGEVGERGGGAAHNPMVSGNFAWRLNHGERASRGGVAAMIPSRMLAAAIIRHHHPCGKNQK